MVPTFLISLWFYPPLLCTLASEILLTPSPSVSTWTSLPRQSLHGLASMPPPPPSSPSFLLNSGNPPPPSPRPFTLLFQPEKPTFLASLSICWGAASFFHIQWVSRPVFPLRGAATAFLLSVLFPCLLYERVFLPPPRSYCPCCQVFERPGAYKTWSSYWSVTTRPLFLLTAVMTNCAGESKERRRYIHYTLAVFVALRSTLPLLYLVVGRGTLWAE